MSKYIPKEIRDRQISVGGEIKDEGDGYFSLIGGNPIRGFKLAYICLPKGHPDGNKDYYDLDPEVNGGLTYGNGPVFGWDYGHCDNYGTPSEDIKGALEYFRERE